MRFDRRIDCSVPSSEHGSTDIHPDSAEAVLVLTAMHLGLSSCVDSGACPEGYARGCMLAPDGDAPSGESHGGEPHGPHTTVDNLPPHGLFAWCRESGDISPNVSVCH